MENGYRREFPPDLSVNPLLIALRSEDFGKTWRLSSRQGFALSCPALRVRRERKIGAGASLIRLPRGYQTSHRFSQEALFQSAVPGAIFGYAKEKGSYGFSEILGDSYEDFAYRHDDLRN